MDPHLQKVVGELEAVEAAAEDVLTDKQQIVDLSRKQSGLREASRAVSSLIKSRGECKTWVAAGNTFIKLPASKVKSLLEDDQLELDKEITGLRDGLRGKVNRLNDLEGRPDVVGFGLKPLSRAETAAVRQVLGDRS
ncbi:p53 and DNA damage-regulated protein 1-like [Amphibalanus amphitrite]|uniref:p53 and DNA damage-regulated protein 1-like n=1 Tax=Amphibalanus amphitrite TaxID=1232801 RepID=UPI001C90603A|nr:p53 and DNA damage-regulated protein 1-like [Amphibalanus amphitrite]XP_043216273.1 p53 and DNA damage-regulated protein 1-like [Amphibalanus amphitrite]XP_043216286.1 p53 and DNA damage-regulated protein 1-like [Amphibalanus amphitrite]XP_043216294.1 p53 and DNA damage-regulated protein 1-like [Amphibalanus amphitrite]XP_043216301.1 p53 and DNA damage-regulated protein 1-like [Amphibalanus amphitrite]XP_043216309.1 p53 and DNA damage-regulated protein 1-like [Amphibalanus amphitrite]